MKKLVSIMLSAIIMVCCAIPFSAFAATSSVGSSASDIAILSDNSYSVTGKDVAQGKESAYTKVAFSGTDATSDCNVYATIDEGGKVYDPTNPNADNNGFVDGSILVGVPTVLVMSGTPDNNGYYVAEGSYKVKGNIAGTTVINVVADDSFSMSSNGKEDITATVTQTFKRFVVATANLSGADVNKNVTPDFNDNAVGKVTVKTNEATAGSWQGEFSFTISTSSIS